MSRVNELNEIKSRKKYKIEKKHSSFAQDTLKYLTELTEEEQNKFIGDSMDIYVSFVELEDCYYKVSIRDFLKKKLLNIVKDMHFEILQTQLILKSHGIVIT